MLDMDGINRREGGFVHSALRHISNVPSIPIYLVGTMSAPVLGGTFAHDFCAISTNSFRVGRKTQFIEPPGANPLRVSQARERVVAHEGAHFFHLATRDENRHHDGGPFVPGIPYKNVAGDWIRLETFGLLNANTLIADGTWLRWEDWVRANESASGKFKGKFGP